ncbi:MAG: 30S ribosomal protein S7 [Holosporales bacterium]|jgi:small subunit ribosomal protein S7|nr:30S ribosomal protein S7 [Holosporales bacterium]
MARRRAAEKREILPDSRFGSVSVSRFINCLMFDGKRSVAERIFYGAVDQAEKKLNQQGLEIFTSVLDNVQPTIEVRSRRVGGATYQVPVEVRVDRARALAMRWLIICATKRNERTMVDKLAGEMVDAFNRRGAAIKKRDDTHKMAEANRAFAHYRW